MEDRKLSGRRKATMMVRRAAIKIVIISIIRKRRDLKYSSNVNFITIPICAMLLGTLFLEIVSVLFIFIAT